MNVLSGTKLRIPDTGRLERRVATGRSTGEVEIVQSGVGEFYAVPSQDARKSDRILFTGNRKFRDSGREESGEIRQASNVRESLFPCVMRSAAVDLGECVLDYARSGNGPFCASETRLRDVFQGCASVRATPVRDADTDMRKGRM